MRGLYLRVILIIMLGLLVVEGATTLIWSVLPHSPSREARASVLEDKLSVAQAHLSPLDPGARARRLPELGHALALQLALEDRPADPPAAFLRLEEGTYLVARHGAPPIFWDRIALQSVLSALCLGMLLWLLGQPLLRDLSRLDRASRRIAEGDLNARVHLGSGPLGELGARFDHMAARIALMLRDQRKVLEAVSHELRTPLARMRFQVDALRPEDDRDPAPFAWQGPTLEALDAEMDIIDGLLSELLDLLRLQQPPPAPMGPGESARVVAEVVERLSPLGSVPILAEGEGDLPLDRRGLERILGNLLSNAQRYAQRRIEVRLEAGRLVVEDDGAGVPEEDRERIFEPFMSAGASPRAGLGGIGLGLAIVARTAQRTGGLVRVDRGPLGGARFTVSWGA